MEVRSGPIIAGDVRALNGDYIHGEPGTVSASLAAIKSSYPHGSTVVMPIFDYIYDPGTMATVFATQPPSIGWATGGGGSDAAYHHIVGFVTATIDKVSATGGEKYVKVDLVKSVYADANITPGYGVNIGNCVPNSQIIAVVLWR